MHWIYVYIGLRVKEEMEYSSILPTSDEPGDLR